MVDVRDPVFSPLWGKEEWCACSPEIVIVEPVFHGGTDYMDGGRRKPRIARIDANGERYSEDTWTIQEIPRHSALRASLLGMTNIASCHPEALGRGISQFIHGIDGAIWRQGNSTRDYYFFALKSLSVTVRLKTGMCGRESHVSAQK